MVFIFYSIGLISYNLMTFSECTEASKELEIVNYFFIFYFFYNF